MEKENISNYIDITKDYYQSAKPKNHNVTHAKKFVDDEDNVFVVNNKRSGAFFDYNSKDYKETIKCAHLLRNLFGGKIELQPIVNYKDGISTCDFKWKPPCSNKLEKWDLKTVEGSKSTTIDSMIKKKKKQSHNFVIDLGNHTINREQAIKQIIDIYSKEHRDWIDKIMLKDNNEIIFIYKRK